MFFRFLLLLLSVAAVGPAANAALVFSIGSTTIAPAGNATIDVFVSSDVGSVSFQSIDVEFYIGPEFPANPYVEAGFAMTDSESFANDPSYVFYLNSDATGTGSPITESNENGYGIDRLFFVDSTADEMNITLNSGESRLLAQLELSHNNPDGEELSYFISVSGSVKDALGAFVPTGGNFGHIDVVAVPEPSCLALMTIATGAIAYTSRRRRASRCITTEG
ncbi:PEP-CTERM sorting domain-containing protein [Rubripirellula reticaptiva]|uniref:PEP-CTERM protein-sorting domain-containing protein n=1 Tax=Rubripirellula reticaptiva TaxID=2528013 RepID=A0A5C6FF59_9BACT|nr:PEP-CTERM sorting domain-containing protein [Rubripirellula reticaptiva]TWU58221.1 hypothetical protein Poly59_11310 [Rubripirellula reticaptiva]